MNEHIDDLQPGDEVKQRVEHEARTEAASETPPEPTPPPEPATELVSVECGNCKNKFEFELEKQVTGFRFQCTACGAQNEVSR